MSNGPAKVARHSISATALSEIAICQQMVALKQDGVKQAPSSEQADWLARGTRMHRSSEIAAQEADAERSSGLKGACYVATLIYGPEHASTLRLRAFRDRVLRRSFLGRYLIAAYYRAAPTVAAYLRRRAWATACVRACLDLVVKVISKSVESRSNGEKKP